MFLTGVGGSQDAMAQIKEGGLYRATFLYNPNMAASAVTMARLLGQGKGFPELVPPLSPRTTWTSTRSTRSTDPSLNVRTWCGWAPHREGGIGWCRGLHTELNPPSRLRQLPS
jgi:hypothetical protein